MLFEEVVEGFEMLFHVLRSGLGCDHIAPSVLDPLPVAETENAVGQRIEGRNVEVKNPVEVEALPNAKNYVVLKL